MVLGFDVLKLKFVFTWTFDSLWLWRMIMDALIVNYGLSMIWLIKFKHEEMEKGEKAWLIQKSITRVQ